MFVVAPQEDVNICSARRLVRRNQQTVAYSRGSSQPRLDLAFTRYCHHQNCMVYGITGGVGGGAYIAQ